MRTSKNLKMMSTDLKRIQKSVKEKTDKQIESIIQLIDLPDFDVSEFFQTLLKSGHHDEVLKGIPQEKLVDFFSRNYTSFIETQDELGQIELPKLEQIPKAKEFYFEEKVEQKNEDNTDESSVIEIVDSFSSAVMEKNNEQIARILKIINEMKNHPRYQQYFESFSVSKLYRESYESFIETCDSTELLLEMGEVAIGLRRFLRARLTDFVSKVRTEVNVDSSSRGVKKAMNKLCLFIEELLREVKEKYSADKFINPLEADTMIPKFLSQLSKEFYQVIEPCIYEKEELQEVLEDLEVVLESSSELESKGVNLSRDLRSLIALDLPNHMNKIVEVVIEAFDDILKDEDELYEFKFFDGLSSMGMELDMMNPIKPGEYGKKCCSQKGILLINAFAIILDPLCDQKWSFLLENVLEQLMEKVTNALSASSWHYWDYYQLFYFFDRLQRGKVKHKRLYEGEEPPISLKDKFATLKKLSYECWEYFETKLTTQFWVNILSRIPDLLWEIKPYAEVKSSSAMKPTVFSIDLVFSMDDFLKQIIYRLQQQQFYHLINRLYEYILYMVEYVLYYAYHHRGSTEKVFTLFRRSERTFKKAKMFSVEDIEGIKQGKRILTISAFTKLGVENLALDLYFLTEAIKYFSEYEKLSCEAEVEKIAQIEAKEHKTEAAKVEKAKFEAGLNKFVKILKEEPEKIRSYLETKRREISK